jgi:hypothetical protein
MQTWSKLPLIAAILFAFVMPAAAQSPTAAGKVERIQGQATATNGSATMQLAVGTEVFEGDVLETGNDARLTVALVDGSSLTLGANAEMEIDRFVFADNVAEDKQTLRWVAGAFLTATGAIGKANQDAVIVNTPVATIGIRGTQFWGGRLEVDFEVLVLEGRVVVITDAGAVELGVNETTRVVNVGTPPAPAAVMPEPRRNQAFATVTYN